MSYSECPIKMKPNNVSSLHASQGSTGHTGEKNPKTPLQKVTPSFISQSLFYQAVSPMRTGTLAHSIPGTPLNGDVE